MKKKLLIIMMCVMLGTAQEVKAQLVHEPFFGFLVFDIGGAFGRTLSTAIKYFLSDDKKTVAKLVYDEGEGGGGGGGGGGGCGGVYKPGSGCNLDLALSAVTSPLTDIFAEVTAYPADVKVQGTTIWELAKYRSYNIVQDRAALDQLSAEQWSIRYKAQQRAIRALTDALVMKKAYAELARIGERVSEGNFSNYGEAASTVATRRLLLDALFALRKRVIAARVRARAETLEVNLEAVPSEPSIERPQDTTPSDNTEDNNNTENNPQTTEASGDNGNGSGNNTGGNS